MSVPSHRGGSTAESAATIGYTVSQTAEEYVYTIIAGVDNKKVKVALVNDRLTFRMPAIKRQPGEPPSDLGDVRQLKLGKAALLDFSKMKVAMEGKGGLTITVPKKA